MRVLKPPLKDEDIQDLRVGDEVYVDGTLIIMRDATHWRIFEEKVEPPIDLRGAAILHSAPSYQVIDNKRKIITFGPTTSMRVEKYTPLLIEKYGVKAIIGKGGMGRNTTEAMKKFKAVYLIFPGGASAIAMTKLQDVEEVYWTDLYGEALWKVRVRNFGPAIVAIDTLGNNLTLEVERRAMEKFKEKYGP
ncbi:MAG: FumA C-terminus/TtdB family hydratase beta subunit [Thaumarchaeota archaeon]|jgi:L(+)-tartrate dehydratase beta subunit|nr:FumA C-terminus/TtdB family hydratase beta subunit [Candidatus Geocrenenecus arthurdayi]MCL7391307.1 FumA C-terminus/TtdB family hydratase beta subunit [Candidatus Geocrenenecus arthurdayi]